MQSFGWMLSMRAALLAYCGLRIIMQEIDVQMSNSEVKDHLTTTDPSNGHDCCHSNTIHPTSDHSMQNNCVGNCPLCLDKIVAPAALPCGHICCWTCITEYIYQSLPSISATASNKCPVCRQEFERQRIRALYSYT